MAVVGEPIEKGGGQDGIPEDLAPAGELQVGGPRLSSRLSEVAQLHQHGERIAARGDAGDELLE